MERGIWAGPPAPKKTSHHYINELPEITIEFGKKKDT